MKAAIELAVAKYKEGGHAIGAIIVQYNNIIAKSFTTVNRDSDPTCHAEINAIRTAAKILDSHFLENCYLYTTFEPCPMCTSAAIWAKMKGIIYGARMQAQTGKYHQRILIPSKEIIKKGSPKLKLYSNFMELECKNLLNLDT